MVMITGTVTGREETLRRINELVPRITQRVKDAVTAATIDLVAHVKIDKLQGGHPLYRRSGNLTDNIFQEVTQTETAITGRAWLGTGARYGEIHEFGLTVERMQTKAWGREMKNPHMVTAHYPKRSFMFSTFNEQRASIVRRIEDAAAAGMAP